MKISAISDLLKQSSDTLSKLGLDHVIKKAKTIQGMVKNKEHAGSSSESSEEESKSPDARDKAGKMPSGMGTIKEDSEASSIASSYFELSDSASGSLSSSKVGNSLLKEPGQFLRKVKSNNSWERMKVVN